MVFSSIPAYLDPANWQQHPNHHQTETGGNASSTDATNPLQLITASSHHHHVGGTGAAAGMGSSIRPGSMAERARLANVPLPEAALKCPRCESINTKFCYFNNYSLTQPRHFCKTCRRYWTRGGALRNVPVGGGCRRNKRSSTKASSSKSPVSSDRQTSTNNNSSSTSTTVSSTATGSPANILGLTTPQIPPLRFLSPLSQLTGHHDHYMSNTTPGGDISLNYNGISAPPNLLGSSSHEMNNFQLGTNNFLGLGGGTPYNSLLSSSIEQQWRLQQTQPFPNLLGGLDSSSSSGLYHHLHFQGTTTTATTTTSVEPAAGGFAAGETSHQVRPNYKLSSSMLTQMASIKMEDMNHELNLSRQLMGIPSNNDQQWTGAAAWTDLSSFSSSSTSNPL